MVSRDARLNTVRLKFGNKSDYDMLIMALSAERSQFSGGKNMNDAFYCMVMTTTGSQEEGERLAAMLVSEKLAACVQITPISSTYTWQDTLQKEPEWLLLIKTKADLYEEVEDALGVHHSYDTPEIIQVPITQGSMAYLSWVDENTKGEDLS
jgi:periplasmic divalent cation tolerance protein